MPGPAAKARALARGRAAPGSRIAAWTESLHFSLLVGRQAGKNLYGSGAGQENVQTDQLNFSLLELNFTWRDCVGMQFRLGSLRSD